MKIRQAILTVLLNGLQALPPFTGRDRLRWELAKFYPPQGGYLTGLYNTARVELLVRSEYERCIWLKMREHEELKQLAALLKPGGIFIDVGANIGLWSLTAASVIGGEGKVYAIEANSKTYLRLVKNVAHNAWQERICAVNIGISDHCGEITFMAQQEHYLSRVVNNNVSGSVRIKVITLDDLLYDSLERVDGIKIDVEGHEGPVIEGAKRIIEAYRPWIVVEYNRYFVQTPLFEEWILYRELAQLGYQAYLWDGFNSKNPRLATTTEIAGRGCVDVVFISRNKH